MDLPKCIKSIIYEYAVWFRFEPHAILNEDEPFDSLRGLQTINIDELLRNLNAKYLFDMNTDLFNRDLFLRLNRIYNNYSPYISWVIRKQFSINPDGCIGKCYDEVKFKKSEDDGILRFNHLFVRPCKNREIQKYIRKFEETILSDEKLYDILIYLLDRDKKCSSYINHIHSEYGCLTYIKRILIVKKMRKESTFVIDALLTPNTIYTESKNDINWESLLIKHNDYIMEKKRKEVIELANPLIDVYIEINNRRDILPTSIVRMGGYYNFKSIPLVELKISDLEYDGVVANTKVLPFILDNIDNIVWVKHPKMDQPNPSYSYYKLKRYTVEF
jgi:hypothetical protein